MTQTLLQAHCYINATEKHMLEICCRSSLSFSAVSVTWPTLASVNMAGSISRTKGDHI